uniref:Protein kinase domain-containing protein n=1 Tax=Panagrellus redivivus TaxID=6233 RepID=A0A7E4VJE2_PANRE
MDHGNSRFHPVLNLKPGARDFALGDKIFRSRNVIFLPPPEEEYLDVVKSDGTVNQHELANFMAVSNIRKHRNVFTYGHILVSKSKDVGESLENCAKNDQQIEVGDMFSLPDITEFTIIRKIGNNGYDAVSPNPDFGRVYLNLESVGRTVSMPTMYHDVHFYQNIKEISTKNRKHFLKQIAFGTVQDEYHWTVAQLGGPNILDLYYICEREFLQPTIIQIAVQSLQAIHDVQLHHHLHRLIDPRSFVCGVGSKHRVIYIIDFSCCYKYVNRERRDILAKGPPDSVVMTPPKRPKMHRRRDSFAPRSYHLANKWYNRMDDVESWFLMLHFILQKDAKPMNFAHERVLYMQKCSIMYGACFPEEFPEIHHFLMAIVKGIDEYDENTKPIIDFPYFAIILESIAELWNVTGKEPMDWAPSPKDRALMILRSTVSTDED